MPIKARLETKGFADYLERIAKAGLDVDAAAKEALQAGGELLLAGMQRRVPKDTGNLHDSLAVEGPFSEGNWHYVTVGLSSGADSETARYGNVQEFGSSSMAAQPYVRPTLDNDMSKARKVMRSVFKKWEVLP